MKIHGDLVVMFDNQCEILQENPKHPFPSEVLGATFRQHTVNLSEPIVRLQQWATVLKQHEDSTMSMLQALAGQTGRQNLGFLMGHHVACVPGMLMASSSLRCIK